VRRRLAERPRDSGVVAVLSVFFVLLLLTFLAVAINIGRLMQTKGDLQHAADSAALAAAESLRGTGAGVLDTQTQARAYASRYRLTTGVTVHHATLNAMANADIRAGHWHEVAGPCKFDGPGAPCPVGFEEAVGSRTKASPLLGINSVQVTTRYTLPTIFNYVMGTGNVAMTATATAVSRGYRVNCALPVAIPSCRDDDAFFPGEFLNPEGGLTIPVAGFRRLVFTSGLANDATLVPPRDNRWAFARVNLTGRQVDDWDTTMENFTRARTLDNKDTCVADGLDTWNYGTQTASTPQTNEPQYVGVGSSPRIEPLVEGLLGIAAVGADPSRDCLLGQVHVVPVVDPPGGDCINQWPPRSPPAVSVIGYVNVIFDRIACSDNVTFIRATAGGVNISCTSTDPMQQTRIRECTLPRGGTSGHLRVEVLVLGNMPIGPDPTRPSDRQSRLVQ
jgi:Flp pilus assembly protein TadG